MCFGWEDLLTISQMKERKLRTLRVSDLILGMILSKLLFMQALANALDSSLYHTAKVSDFAA